MEPIKVDIQNIDQKTTLVVGDLIVFYEMSQDYCPANPLEDWDGNGNIISLNRNHRNFDPDGFHEAVKNNPSALVLSYFEHGGSVWSLQGEGPQCRFDTAQVAGVWIPDKDVMDNIQAIQNAKPTDEASALREYAQGVLKVYNQWCNGEVYHINIEVYSIVKDEYGTPITSQDYYETNRETIDGESCGGFYGWQETEQEMSDLINGYVKNQKVEA